MLKRLAVFGLGLVFMGASVAGAQPDRERYRPDPSNVERRYDRPGVRHPDGLRYGMPRPYWQPVPPRRVPRYVYVPPVYGRPIIVPPLYPDGFPSVYAYIEYLEWLRRQEAIRRLRQHELELLYR